MTSVGFAKLLSNFFYKVNRCHYRLISVVVGIPLFPNVVIIHNVFG